MTFLSLVRLPWQVLDPTVVSSPNHTLAYRERGSGDFLGPGSNIFPGMSGKESDWSEGQLLRNTNHIDRMMALKIPRHDCSLMPDVLDRIIRAAFVSIGYESPTDDQRLAITEFNLSKGKTFSSASRLEKARVCVLLLCLLSIDVFAFLDCLPRLTRNYIRYQTLVCSSHLVIRIH